MPTPHLTNDCTARCSFPLPVERGYGVALHVYEDLASQAVMTSQVEAMELEVHYETQTDSQEASFRAFHQACFTTNWATYKGVFYWNNPRTGETDIKVRFKDAKWKPNPDGPTVWSWTVTLVKVAS